MRVLTALLVLFGLFCGPATAETDQTLSVLGAWGFTARTPDACEFSGIAHLRAGKTPDLHACELTARHACSGQTYVVRQSCSARQSAGQLIIRSKIVEFLEGEPTASYWPDNFILTIESEDRMIGALLSHGSHAAEFKRTSEGVS